MHSQYLLLFFTLVLGKGSALLKQCQQSDTIVQLFEWRWDDIAEECERFLGPNGYCAVQISPPNEYRIVESPLRPWYERFQPVSYKTITRSGNDQQFRTMVERCNNAGVQIYADVIFNHMVGADKSATGVGIGGSTFNSETLDFPGVPYNDSHFNHKGIECTSASGNVEPDSDIVQVRNCRLYSLVDLKQSVPYVRETIVKWLNSLTDAGVSGFLFNAATNMWPQDLISIVKGLNNLPTKWFQPNSKPFIYQEIVLPGDSPVVSPSEYFDVGLITDLNYGLYLSSVFSGKESLKVLKNLGTGFRNLVPSEHAFIFIDNQDTQRYEGAAGEILTFFDHRQYEMAVTFMLAWPYGVAKVMSSYSWPRNIVDGQDLNNWIMPPSYPNFTTKPVEINTDGCCAGDWVCEHRWPAISSMVEFRKVAAMEPVANWWDDGENQIAFSRGSKAFFAMNAGAKDLKVLLNSGMPPGRYCDVISGRKTGAGTCSGNTIEVDANGKVTLLIAANAEKPVVAFSVTDLLANGSPVSTNQISIGAILIFHAIWYF